MVILVKLLYFKMMLSLGIVKYNQFHGLEGILNLFDLYFYSSFYHQDANKLHEDRNFVYFVYVPCVVPRMQLVSWRYSTISSE